jgi:hypothetical protein
MRNLTYAKAWKCLEACREHLDKEARLGRLITHDTVFGLSVRFGWTEEAVRRVISEGGLQAEIKGGEERFRIDEFVAALPIPEGPEVGKICVAPTGKGLGRKPSPSPVISRSIDPRACPCPEIGGTPRALNSSIE